MRTSIGLFGRVKYILMAVLFVAACYSSAETINYNLAGNINIWQITGTSWGDGASDEIGLDMLGCYINCTLTQDNAGKLTGGGDFNCGLSRYGTSVDIDGIYTITGSITQKNNIATVKINIKISFVMYYESAEESGHRRFNVTEKINAIINTESNTLEGTAKIAGETLDFAADLPDDMDGSSEFLINITPADAKGTKLSGNGTLTLSNGDLYNYIVKGSYNAKKGLDKLTLTGTGKPSSGKLTLTINDASGNLNTLKGKSLGQTLAASNIPAE